MNSMIEETKDLVQRYIKGAMEDFFFFTVGLTQRGWNNL